MRVARRPEMKGLRHRLGETITARNRILPLAGLFRLCLQRRATSK
jgi:hypothetical protein